MTYKIFFDRKTHSIDGVLTIQDARGNKIIDRIHVRSGQKGNESTNWVRGKSPIPFGTYELSLLPYNKGQSAGETGIGQFYPIGNDGKFYAIVQGKRQRTGIGLHEENKWAGSAGCIVVVRHADWLRVCSVLGQIAQEGFAKLPITVL